MFKYIISFLVVCVVIVLCGAIANLFVYGILWCYFNFIDINSIQAFAFDFKYTLIITTIVLGFSSMMKDTTFILNKEKSIYKKLTDWRKARNIKTPNYKVYFENIIEELLEPMYDKEMIKTIKTQIVNSYYKDDILLSEYDVVDTINDIEVFTINERSTMGYSTKKCMNQTIKEIESRIQDQIQKEEWKKFGASGKWQKDKSQNEVTLYKADYSKCKKAK